ncbi:unnamed protein product [Ascophyllum nodosum]
MAITNVSARAPRRRENLSDNGMDSERRRGPSKFSKGAVWRLRLVNFLVYEDTFVEFGPRLNVVIGPNGCGKSTLVCAITLGLGGSPKLLGRADNLSSFVMLGSKEDASVEVELFLSETNRKKEGMIFKRVFSRKNNSSRWFINKRSVTDKDVKEKTAELGIQVENLCTMLPQDKVGDFSGLTPDKLLLETEKALSVEQLYQPHLKLIEMQESTGKKINEEETIEKKLEGLTTELSTVEEDVQRYQEREEKQQKLDLHVMRRAWVHVEDLQGKGLQSKNDQKAAQEELRKAELEDKPLQDEMVRWEKSDHRMRNIVNDRENRRRLHEKEVKAADERIEKLVSETRNTKSQISNIETRRKMKEEDLAKKKAALVSAQEKVEGLKAQAPQAVTQGEIKARSETHQRKMDDVSIDLEAAQALHKKTIDDVRDIDFKVKELTNIRAQREECFKNKFGDDASVALTVRDWAVRNRNQLSGPVAGPVGLEVTVDDEEAATAVEFHVPRYVWCSLVVNSKHDHDVIVEAFKDQRRPLSILTNEGGGLKNQVQVFSLSEMASLQETAGVRGFLDDFITCPDTIRQVLRRNNKIHRAFLGSAATQLVIASDPRFLPSLGKPVKGIPTGCVIYAGGKRGLVEGQAVDSLQQYSAKISLYGNRGASTRVTETSPARVLKAAVDQSAVESLKKENEELDVKRRNAEDKIKKCRALQSDLRKKFDDFKKQLHNAQNYRKQIDGAERTVERMEGKIKDIEAELAAGGDAEKTEKTARLAKIFENHVATVASAQKELSGLLDASLEHAAATVVKNATSAKFSGAKAALYQAQNSRKELQDGVRRLTQQTTRLKREFAAAKSKAEARAPRYVNGNPAQLTTFGMKYSSLPSTTDSLDATIEDIKEDLAGTIHNPQVILKYEKLQKEVEESKKALEELKESNANAESTMSDVHNKWKEMLQNIVEKLNVRFGGYMVDMGCLGAISLSENDSSYRKWGVSIRVRFRSEADGGRLTELSKHVQSGGERSVSTILYLMALQDLQHSPFRVVDEINQGMDPNNERRVFSRVVKNSCGPDRKQYFLVTPKLLQGLVAIDNEDVTVIVIMNGMNVFRGKPEHSMKRFIQAKKRALEEGGGQGSSSKPKHAE